LEKYLINNPWKELIEKMNKNHTIEDKCYALNQEVEIINSFNKSLTEKSCDLYKIHTHIHPSHYTGNILKAKVILLATNPGYNQNEESTLYQNSIFHKEVHDHLIFQNNRMLSTDVERKNQSIYWHDKLKSLIKETSFEIVSKYVAKIQFFPYHSIKYRSIPKKHFSKNNIPYLKSQLFGFDLVKDAVKKGKLIVLLRSKKEWFKAIKELEQHQNEGMLIEIKNKRQPYLTPNNFYQTSHFEKIKETLWIE